MRLFSRWSTLALLAIGSGTLLAQPSPDASGTVEVTTRDPARATTTLSIGEMKSLSAALADKVKADARHVLYLREIARKERDVIKLTCVNDKLVQIKALQNIFSTAYEQLQGALVGADEPDTRYALYDQVNNSGQSIRKLREEAEACVGELQLSPEDTSVDVTEPEIPDDPTAEDPFDPGLEPPGYASPFR